jgi:hypothetical protein
MILQMSRRLVTLNRSSEIYHSLPLTAIWNFTFRITFTELGVLHVVTKAKEVPCCSYYQKN